MIKLTGLEFTGLHGRFEVYLIDNRLLLVQLPTCKEVYRSEAVLAKGRDRDELLWRAADAIVGAVAGRVNDPNGDASGMVHDLLEVLMESNRS